MATAFRLFVERMELAKNCHDAAISTSVAAAAAVSSLKSFTDFSNFSISAAVVSNLMSMAAIAASILASNVSTFSATVSELQVSKVWDKRSRY